MDAFKIDSNQTNKMEAAYKEQLKNYQNELFEKIYIDRTVCLNIRFFCMIKKNF